MHYHCFRCLVRFSVYDHLAWGREIWSKYFSCICLFILHALLYVFFLFILVSAVGCDLCLWHSLIVSFNFFAKCVSFAESSLVPILQGKSCPLGFPHVLAYMRNPVYAICEQQRRRSKLRIRAVWSVPLLFVA